MKTARVFVSQGLVYGKLYDGSMGAYPAKNLSATTKKELLKVAKVKLEDKSLDKGMGFDYLKGALLYIKTITTIIVKGKPYTNEKNEKRFIGSLTAKEMDFLEETNMSYL